MRHSKHYLWIIISTWQKVLTKAFLGTLFAMSAYAQDVNSHNPLLIDKAFPKDLVAPSGQTGYTLNTKISTFDNSKWFQGQRRYFPTKNDPDVTPLDKSKLMGYDEATVFKLELKHRDYALRIGKGGQLYSIVTPIGEICPLQNCWHAWIDDTWLLTTYQYDLKSTGNAFIHQCGVYPHFDAEFQQGKLNWTPIVAEKWDAENNAYSSVSWGYISTGPSQNRADVLMYHKTRDLGNGAFEVVYMAYNYNSSYPAEKAEYTTDFGPWGGVRTSKLPVHMISKADGTLESYAGGKITYRNSNETDGWAISTAVANDKNSYSLGYVFGKIKPEGTNWKAYSTCTTKRDFTVQAVTFRQPIPPGRLFYCRFYFSLGKYNDVVNRCKAMESKTTGGFLDYEQSRATKIPLYLKQQGSQTVIAEQGDIPAFYVFAEPVMNSKPLYLIRNTKTGQLHATCDPYMIMPLYTRADTGKKGYRPYDGTTDIIKIYGYVMPKEFCESSIQYVPLEQVLEDRSFYPGKGLYDTNIMAPKK